MPVGEAFIFIVTSDNRFGLAMNGFGLVWRSLAFVIVSKALGRSGRLLIGERLWVIFVPLGPVLPGHGLKPADDPFVLRYAVWPLRPRRLYSQQVGIPVTPVSSIPLCYWIGTVRWILRCATIYRTDRNSGWRPHSGGTFGSVRMFCSWTKR